MSTYDERIVSVEVCLCSFESLIRYFSLSYFGQDSDMLIIVLLLSQIDGTASLGTLKAIIEAETGIPSSAQVVFKDGRVLSSSESTLESLGFVNDDVVMVEKNLSSSTGRSPPQMRPDGSAENPEQLMHMLTSAGYRTNTLPPSLTSALKNNNVQEFQNALRALHQERVHAAEEEQRFMKLAAEDPLNPEVQRKLQEIIDQKNVAENFENAIEYNPEAFSTVTMLYVDMEVNGKKLKAFVDSGAQMTIMSKKCAEQCGILRLMDTRFRGTAVGVGKAEILGRVHMAPLKAGGCHIPVSITILDQEGMEFLFGLDNLKRHQCNIDLHKSTLGFPILDVELPFLSEHEIPKSALFNQGEMQGDAKSPVPSPPKPPSSSQQQNEEKITTLMQLGFPREKCIAALQAAGGNEDMAASLLFSM